MSDPVETPTFNSVEEADAYFATLGTDIQQVLEECREFAEPYVKKINFLKAMLTRLQEVVDGVKDPSFVLGDLQKARLQTYAYVARVELAKVGSA
jgi:hypothetical protein